MDDRNNQDWAMVIAISLVLIVIIGLVIFCVNNPGGGVPLSMAVYTRHSSAKLVRQKRRPGCCLVPAALAIALSAVQALCILGKLIGAVALPWLVVLAPLLVAMLAVLLFAPAGRR